MPATVNQSLPVVRVGEIPSAESAPRWLVEGLWGAHSVGVIGGAPKCAKTWLGLDMALSVATGTACLGQYAVPEPGPVLVYLAEDALPVVRERIQGMARHRGLDFAAVEIYVITAPVLRLDRDPDRTRLWETTRRLRPRLLVLDPLVRLHGIDENHAGEVAELLAYFRKLMLSSEHRAAPASPPVSLELVATDAATTHLEVIAELQDGKRRSLEEQVLDLLAPGTVLTRAKLRDSLAVQNERLGVALESLERAGRLCRTPAGWQRLDGSSEGAVPVPQREIGNGTVLAHRTAPSPSEEPPCQESTSTKFALRSR